MILTDCGITFTFLPLDEGVASRAVFVIVSRWDGQAGRQKRFWSQLINFFYNSKTVRDRPHMCQ